METSPDDQPTEELHPTEIMIYALRHKSELLGQAHRLGERRQIFEECDILLDGLAEVGYLKT